MPEIEAAVSSPHGGPSALVSLPLSEQERRARDSQIPVACFQFFAISFASSRRASQNVLIISASNSAFAKLRCLSRALPRTNSSWICRPQSAIVSMLVPRAYVPPLLDSTSAMMYDEVQLEAGAKNVRLW